MPKEYQPKHLRPIMTPPRTQVLYAIGEEDQVNSSLGFWQGPHPDEREMLEVEGQSDKSVIIRFNVDGTNEVIWRWNKDRWIEIEK